MVVASVVVTVFAVLSAGTSARQEGEAAPGRVLVKFKPAITSVAKIEELQRTANVQDTRHVMHGNGLQVWTTAPEAVQGVVAMLRADSAVEYAEPDYILRPLAVSNDPMLGSLWGMATARATVAWADGYTGSADVVVGVVDTGVDERHPDLAANMWVNAGEIPANGVDDDGNGVIDDVHGITSYQGNVSGNATDRQYHGTHCAGTIGAVGGNGIGVVGVSWRVSIMALRFLAAPDSTGYTSDAVACIRYALARKAEGVNLRVLSNSYGSSSSSAALQQAVADAVAAGVVFVAAAGNDGVDIDSQPNYPASYAGALTVAATGADDTLAWFSNYGSAGTVRIAAPGMNITSCAPGGGYKTLDGTSMATPFVAGTLALMAAAHPARSGADLTAALLRGAAVVPALSGVAGFRRVDVPAAIREVTASHVPGLVPAVVPAPAVPAVVPSEVPALAPGTHLQLLPGFMFVRVPDISEVEVPALAPGVVQQFTPAVVPAIVPAPPPSPAPAPEPEGVPTAPSVGGSPTPVAPPPTVVGAQPTPVAPPRATVRVRFGTRDCGNAEPARAGVAAACGCDATARCEAGRQGSNVVEVTAAVPATDVAALAALVAGGRVSGVPPSATVTTNGAAVPVPAVGATAYLRAALQGDVQCPADVAACAAQVLAGGFDVGSKSISCVCAASRVVGPLVVTLAPADGVDPTAFARAVAAAFGACVSVSLPPAAAGGAGAVVASACPPTRGGSKKGLLGLLGLLGLIPLLLCLAMLGCCLVRRRRKAAEVRFAAIECPGAFHPGMFAPVSPMAGSILASEMQP